MKHRALILVSVALAVALIFSINNVKAYDDNGTYFTCYNCSDCINALNNNTYNEVRLGADISNFSGIFCINNPENFSNKLFDCQEHVVDGDDSMGNDGVFLGGKENNTIRNCIITDFDHGFWLLGVENITIENNNISSCIGDGISALNSINIEIRNNAIGSNNATGIYVHNSNNIIIFNNTLSDNMQRQIALEEGSSFNNVSNNNISIISASAGGNAIYLLRALNNTFSSNYIETTSTSSDAIWLDDDSSDNLITRNVLVCTQCDVAGIAIIGGTGTVEQNNITYNDISNFSVGIYYVGAFHYITNNKIYNCSYGIDADYSLEDVFYKNEIFNCGGGININSGTGIVLEENQLYNNTNNLVLFSLTYTNITQNMLSNSSYGISFSGNNSNISYNTIENNFYGIYAENSQDNVIERNNFSKNNYSIELFATTAGSCAGNAVPCYEIPNQTACDQQQGCSWSGNTCQGIALPCSIFINQSDCTRQLGCSWQLGTSSNYRFNITNNTLTDCEFGLYLMGLTKPAHNHTIVNNQISGCSIGLFLKNLRDSSFQNLVLDNDLDLVSSGRNNFFEEVTFKSTEVSFNYSGDINVSHATMQGSAPSGMVPIGKFLEIKNSTEAQVNITFFYQDSDLGNVNSENSLGLWKRIGSTWQEVPDYVLNTTSNYIYAELNDFSLFAILGTTAEEGGGGGGGGYIPPVCGDGVCDSRRESYLNCPRDCSPPSEPPENVSQDLGDVGNGTYFEGGSGDAFRFEVKGQEHIAQIDGINDDSITLWIWSSPMQISLNLGEAKQIDLDGNNFAELEILLSKIENSKAFLFFKEIAETAPPSAPEQPPAQPQPGKPFPWLWVIIGAVVVAIVVAVILWGTHDKKLSRMGYK